MLDMTPKILPRMRKRDKFLNRFPKKGEVWGHKGGKRYHIIGIYQDFIHTSNKVVILESFSSGSRKAIDLEDFMGKTTTFGREIQRFRKILV